MESDGSNAVIENTDTENMHDFVLPYTSTMKTSADNNVPMTAASRYSLNMKTVNKMDVDTRIIPTPYQTIIPERANIFNIEGIILMNYEILGIFTLGASDLLSKLGISTSGNHEVTFAIGTLPAEIADSNEAYTLELTVTGTTITATDASGLFNGLMSFIGLLDLTNNNMMTLKEMTVHDRPRFDYRGHQVDTARNFRSIETIMKTIDAMALWKVRTLERGSAGIHDIFCVLDVHILTKYMFVPLGLSIS